jgi:hypothetical protein
LEPKHSGSTVHTFLEAMDRLERKIDRQADRLGEIERRLAVGAEKINGHGKHAERLEALEKFAVEVAVKLSLIWAGLAVAGTVAVGGAVVAVINLMGEGC